MLDRGSILGLLLSLTAFAAPLQSNARAGSNQIGNDVRTYCSQYELGEFHFWQCDSTVALIDATTSKVFYCHGVHLIVTTEDRIHQTSVRAECALTFQPYSRNGDFTLLDMTKNQLPNISKSQLYPDGVAWIATIGMTEIQFCSQFLAGQIGIQNRCVSATFK